MEKIRKYAERLGDFLLPFLLCGVIMSAALYIYTENVFDWYTALAVVLTAACFAVFEQLRKIKFGGIFYFALLILMSFTPNIFIRRDEVFDFIQWFFSGAQAVATRPSFALPFTILFGFFFASVIYYFTRIVYRSAAVVLVSLIPFALAVKVVMTMPTYYPAIIAALNLFIFIFYGRKNLLKNSKRAGVNAIAVYGDFALAAALLAMIIPKPDETPFYDKFEAATSMFQFGGSGLTEFRGTYTQYSGNADDYLKGESRLLYVISSPEPAYMKVQVYDLYDEEMRYWIPLEEINGDKNWKASAELLNFEKLAAAVNEAAETSPEIYEKYPMAERLGEITETETYSIVYTRDYPAAYVLAPLRTKDILLSNIEARYSARSDKGELFTDRFLPADANYTVRYYSESVSEALTAGGFCDMSLEDYGGFLSDIFSEYIIYFADDDGTLNSANIPDSEGYRTIKAFYSEYNNAVKYKKDTETKVSAEIQELADSLTAGLEYDYQKAVAIEQYFHSGGFLYSIAYEAPEELDTPEYFLFNSKTGTCSDFATAYTLLARAAGLTVRYVEGFSPSRRNNSANDAYYYIYTEDAHAYPEVFIPMAGWVRYEPTIARLDGGGNGNGDNGDTDYLIIMLTSIVVVVGLGIFILLVIFTPRILESIFRIRVRFSDNNKAVILLYNRHLKTLGTRLEIDPLPLTPEEASAVTKGRTGIPLEPLAEAFNAACYGERLITNGERCKAYDCYRSQYKEIKRKIKRKETIL